MSFDASEETIPHVSSSAVEFWVMFFNSLLMIEYSKLSIVWSELSIRYTDNVI